MAFVQTSTLRFRMLRKHKKYMEKERIVRESEPVKQVLIQINIIFLKRPDLTLKVTVITMIEKNVIPI